VASENTRALFANNQTTMTNSYIQLFHLIHVMTQEWQALSLETVTCLVNQVDYLRAGFPEAFETYQTDPA